MTPAEAAALIAERASWGYSRSSGPGGQRRDHAETRAELTIRPGDLDALPERLAERLRSFLALDERPLRLTSQAQRSRERNRDVVVQRLTDRVTEAMAPGAPPRRPTRPSRGARRRRLADKSHRAQTKAGRRPPRPDD